MPINNLPPLLQLLAFAAITIGLPVALYLFLTRARRRTMLEIRHNAESCGWRYRLQRWQGNPTAFHIEGKTHSGLSWVMKSSATRGYDRGWTAVLALRFPALGGEVDFAMLPREAGQASSAAGAAITPSAEARVAKFSGALASGLDFFQHAQELASGLPEFDAAFRVLVLPKQFSRPPVDASLAARILHWPADTVAPHSVLAWRDAFGLCMDARLPGPANWNTVSYLATLAEDLCAAVPAPLISAAPPTIIDRVVGSFLRPQ